MFNLIFIQNASKTAETNSVQLSNMQDKNVRRKQINKKLIGFYYWIEVYATTPR